jgi:hypothetical protein
MKTKIFELRSIVSKELEPSLKTKIPDPKRRRRWNETKKTLPMLQRKETAIMSDFY